MSDAKQLDLDGNPQKIDPGPPAPVDPGPPPVQLGFDVDVPVAIRKRKRGPVVAWQDPLA